MPLRELLGSLELDPESISTDREVSMGLARAHQRQAEEIPEGEARGTRLLAAATEYRRAGAHSILLSDWKLVGEMFENAGQAYRQLGIPYELMMLSFSRDPLTLTEENRWSDRQVQEQTQTAYLLLALAAGGREMRPGVLEELDSASASPIGILGLPAGAYVDLAIALAAREGNGRKQIEAAVLPFLAAYSSAVALSYRDRLHWGMMILPFHPAEPDILSVMFFAEAVLRRQRGGSLLDWLSEVPLPPVATKILLNAIAERFDA